MIKIIKYGMKIHPGNMIYAITIAVGFGAGLQNIIPWWSGFVICIFLLPLYVYTSYSVGKANWDFTNNKPK